MYTLLVCLDIFAYFNFLVIAWFYTLFLNRPFTILIQTVLLNTLENNPLSTVVTKSYDPCCADHNTF